MLLSTENSTRAMTSRAYGDDDLNDAYRERELGCNGRTRQYELMYNCFRYVFVACPGSKR
jgi:hypothetical protein